MKKVLVAGSTGLAGSAILREFQSDKQYSVFGGSTIDVDFRDYAATLEYMGRISPDIIIVAAAKVGGIMANKNNPVSFLLDNLKIQNNILETAASHLVPKLVFLGSSCIYPKFAEQPITENALMTGALEPTNESYAIAKIAGLRLVEAYRQELSLDWVSAMPTNLYGPGDNFHPDTAHVLPALIAKFHEAKVHARESVALWGTGTPMREFLHTDDLARGVKLIAERYNSGEHINIGVSSEVSIRDLANLISRIVGYKGSIEWDSSKPNGTPRKLLDSAKIRKLGFSPKIQLEKGIEQTYRWYVRNLGKMQ